jgi:ribonuclease BN (tRNA processing enzyme)
MLGEVWDGACLFTFYGPGDPKPNLTNAIRPPWFPVSLDEAPEPVAFKTMQGSVANGPLSVSSFDVQHPQGGIGYRIEGPNRSIGIVTDHESAPDCDDIVAAAIEGVDILVHDAQYLPDEAASHVGWGHSTWEDAVRMAKRVGASELILTSHEPSRTDTQIESMVSDASAEFSMVRAAAPGMRIPL